MSKASDLARLMTSGSTAIHGEAGVTSSGSTGLTTNLQQGLCKQWCKHTGSGVTVVDTFNTSSVTDSGTGLYAPVFTNNMNNAVFPVLQQMNPYTYTSSSKTVLNGCRANHSDGVATTHYIFKTGQVSEGGIGSAIDVTCGAGIVGDLA